MAGDVASLFSFDTVGLDKTRYGTERYHEQRRAAICMAPKQHRFPIGPHSVRESAVVREYATGTGHVDGASLAMPPEIANEAVHDADATAIIVDDGVWRGRSDLG